MTFATSDMNLLKSLSCFDDVVDISPISAGLSHSCFKVITPLQSYFAKRLHLKTAQQELFCSVHTAQFGLSPNIIYHDNDWLVTEFIDGITLDKARLCTNDKLPIALSLMAKLHMLPPQSNTQTLNSINTTTLAKNLFTNCESLELFQRSTLKNINQILSLTIDKQQGHSVAPNVLCHGDINYSNIMLVPESGKSNRSDVLLDDRSWLLDFECAQLAPVEFDIAMFIAVNNIPFDLVDEVVAHYLEQSPEFIPNYRLLDNYILYSFFINALWYFTSNINLNSKTQLKQLVIEQCSAFDNYSAQQGIVLPSLMAILS